MKTNNRRARRARLASDSGKRYLAAKLGNAAPTSESELQAHIVRYCRERDWYCQPTPFGRRTRGIPGAADIIVWIADGPVVCIECKVGVNKLTREQEAVKKWLIKDGHRYWEVRRLREFMVASDTARAPWKLPSPLMPPGKSNPSVL